MVLTSEDHNQVFGLPATLDARETAVAILKGNPITNAVVRDGTLDIRLDFSKGKCLEILPSSAGYVSGVLASKL